MNDKQYLTSLVHSVIDELPQNLIATDREKDHVKAVREYLWPNNLEKILLVSHSKHPLHEVRPFPDFVNKDNFKISFRFMLPKQPPPKGKYYAMLGGEGAENRSGYTCALIGEDGGLVCRHPDEDGREDNIEKIALWTTDSDGLQLRRKHNLNKFDWASEGGKIFIAEVYIRSSYTIKFEYLLHDDAWPTVPLSAPIWDFKISNTYTDNRPSGNYQDIMYLPMDDGWSDFPILKDDGNMKTGRDAITTKTQAADWAGIDHDANRVWQNLIRVGRDGEYYGYDSGWIDPSHAMGFLKSAISPEGYGVKALYQKGASGKDFYVESIDAWKDKQNLFTVNFEKSPQRFVLHRYVSPQGETPIEGLYKMADFGSYPNLHDDVGKTQGLIFHTKNYAVPEYDKPVYFWSTRTSYICMPNSPENIYKSSVKGFSKNNKAKIRFKLITPKLLPPENRKYAIMGVKAHGKSSIPLNMINDKGVLKWDFRNTQIVSASEEKYDLYVDGVQKTHKSPVDELGKEVQIELVAKSNGGYFYYLGSDFGLENYIIYPMPIFNLEMEEYGEVYLYADLKGGYTNHPISPDLTGNKRHIYFKGADSTNYAPIDSNGKKDEANAGVA